MTTNNINNSLGKDSDSKEQKEKKMEGKVETWGAPCSLLKLGESDQLELWGTPWDSSTVETSWLSDKDLHNNKLTMIPASGQGHA